MKKTVTEIKNMIIKWLGGYTRAEYERYHESDVIIREKIKDTLADKINLVNEHQYHLLQGLVTYMQKLYGVPPEEWMSKVYNVITNNRNRILALYVSGIKTEIFRLETSLDEKPTDARHGYKDMYYK